MPQIKACIKFFCQTPIIHVFYNVNPDNTGNINQMQNVGILI